jgi:hypothetical protein
MIVIMQKVLQTNDTMIERDTITIDKSAQWSIIGVDGVFETTIGGDIFGKRTGDQIKNTFSDLMLIAFALLILYGIIQVLVKFMKDGIWWEIISNVARVWWQALSTLPMIPIPLKGGGFSRTSLSSLGKVAGNIGRQFDQWFREWAADQDTAITNKLREAVGLKPELSSSAYKWLTSIATRIGKYTWTHVSAADYDYIMKEYEPIVKSYKWEARSISDMNNSGRDVLSLFLKNIANNQIQLSTFGDFSGKLDKWWTKADGKEKSPEEFITENYNKSTQHAKFFKAIYEKLWWNSESIYSGKAFWSEAIKRKK